MGADTCAHLASIYIPCRAESFNQSLSGCRLFRIGSAVSPAVTLLDALLLAFKAHAAAQRLALLFYAIAGEIGAGGGTRT